MSDTDHLGLDASLALARALTAHIQDEPIQIPMDVLHDYIRAQAAFTISTLLDQYQIALVPFQPPRLPPLKINDQPGPDSAP